MCYKDEVNEKFQDKLNERLEELNVPKFISNFFDSKINIGSAQTKYKYWNIYEGFFNYLLNDSVIEKNNISEITEDDIKLIKATSIERYLVNCKKQLNNSSVTINNKLNYLKSLFSYFLKDDIIEKDIMQKIPKIKTQYKEIEFATLEDKKMLLNNISKMKNEYDRIRNIAIIELLMGSGIRVAECAGLDIKDLFLEGDKPYIIVIRKGGNTDKVFITIDSRIALQEYLLIRDERVDDKNDNIVFLSEKTSKKEDKLGSKERVTENSIYKFIVKYSDGKLTPHMFRKGMAMMILNSDKGSIDAVAQQLGNTPTIARRYYASINENRMTDLLNSL